MVADYICNQFFEHNRTFYAEEEFLQDGGLIYSPPILYHVGIDETERHYQKE